MFSTDPSLVQFLAHSTCVSSGSVVRYSLGHDPCLTTTVQLTGHCPASFMHSPACCLRRGLKGMEAGMPEFIVCTRPPLSLLTVLDLDGN